MRAKEAETKQVPIWHGSDPCTFWTTLCGIVPVLISVELNHQQWLKKMWVSWVAQWWQHRHRFVFCDSQAVSSSQEDHLQHLQQSKPALQFSSTIRESHSPAQFRLIIWYHPNSFCSRAMGRRCNVHIWSKLTMIEIDQVPTTDIPNLHHTRTIRSLCRFLVWFIFGANLWELTPPYSRRHWLTKQWWPDYCGAGGKGSCRILG